MRSSLYLLCVYMWVCVRVHVHVIPVSYQSLMWFMELSLAYSKLLGSVLSYSHSWREIHIHSLYRE